MLNTNLINRLVAANHTVKSLLRKLDEIEKNSQIPVNEKALQIGKIKEEMTKIAQEIDNINKEIKLLRSYNIN